ncbi:hypothetical protein EDD22DRAFT_851693 [Suillus occidentalis]|nr:hypothetical protein EDD22DRAFT_851693 [Suillus occidentalis]
MGKKSLHQRELQKLQKNWYDLNQDNQTRQQAARQHAADARLADKTVSSNVTDTKSSDLFVDLNDNKDAAYTIYDKHLAKTTMEPKRCRRTAADNPIALWLKECETYLLELLQLEGHGDYIFKALRKSATQNSAFYDDFVILDVNSVHQVAVDFCACEIAQSPTTQLLHTHWFPAMTIDPKTAATFCLLHHFHILTFESKASAFEVWQTLSRLTDNTGLSALKDRYEALLQMASMPLCKDLVQSFVQHVLNPAKTYHRAGKMHLQKFVTKIEDSHRWLYGLFLMIDANFHLVQKNVSSDSINPSLSKGWAYFVEEHGYKIFLQDVGKQPQEKSTCKGENSRHDTPDNHFGNFNWKKVTNLGISLLQQLKGAIPEHDQHQHDFDEFNETLIMEHPEEVQRWKQGVEEWETDMSVANPFNPTTANMTQALVRLTLSQEESEELERGSNNSLHNEVSPAVLISSSIVLGDHATDLQRSKLQDHTNILQCKIEQWSQVQVLYMPSVTSIRTAQSSSTNTSNKKKTYKIRLFLLSQLKKHAPDTICDKQLCQFEWKLRHAQVFDALNNLCWHLLLCTHLYKFKNINIQGQTLAEDGWQTIFPVLESAHVHGMSEGEASQFEGNHTLSWIWKVQGVSATGEVLADALCIEWCKARACVNHWTEEVQLLLEKIQCVREFLSWHATWWDEQAG